MNRFFTVIFLMSVLVACQSQETVTPTNEPVPETVEITSNEFIVWGQSAVTLEIDTYMETVFEERYPEIDVVFVDAGWDEALRQNFENAINIGRPPEIVIGENYFRSFAARGELQPVTAIYEQYPDVIPATYAAATYEDEIYAVPYLTGIFAFERNCDVIQAAGLDCDDVPETWDELLTQAETITEASEDGVYGYTIQGPGGTAVGAAFRIAVYQAQLDALPCADDGCTIPDFNRAETLPVYEFLRELHAFTPPGLSENTFEGEVYEALFRGVSAYQIAGSWHPNWAQTAGCTSCMYSAVPVAEGGQSANLLVGNVLFGAPSNSQYPDLALEWLALLMSDEVQSQIFEQTGRLPIRSSVLEAIQPDVDEATSIFIEQLLTSDNLRLLPQWAEHPRETWLIYNDLLEGVLFTTRPIPELMAEAQASVEALE